MPLPWRKMAQRSNNPLAGTPSTRKTHVDFDKGYAVPPTEPTLHKPASANDHCEKEHALASHIASLAPEPKPHSFDGEEEDRLQIEDGNRQDEGEQQIARATSDDEDDPFLEDDPANMSSWAGQPSVKGSSETVRMMLLTFSSVGMTYVICPP